ncbi:hypothetical protein BOM24_10075 [Tatumella sp. OPLPL6]|nr:hypothetical protein BOM24_10075 [Tatumella sp. OPLPL6]
MSISSQADFGQYQSNWGEHLASAFTGIIIDRFQSFVSRDSGAKTSNNADNIVVVQCTKNSDLDFCIPNNFWNQLYREIGGRGRRRARDFTADDNMTAEQILIAISQR